jgi:hypothetical protein
MKKVFGAILVCLFCCRMSAQEQPIFSASFGYIHLDADQHGAVRADFDGWYALPQYPFTRRWSVIPEFRNFYGSPGGKRTNIHGYAFDPLYAFNTKTPFTPFVFGETGDVRTFAPRDTENAFSFVGGLGVNKLVNRMSLQILPGDYILTEPSLGALHHYAAQVALAFDFASK